MKWPPTDGPSTPNPKIFSGFQRRLFESMFQGFPVKHFELETVKTEAGRSSRLTATSAGENRFENFETK